MEGKFEGESNLGLSVCLNMHLSLLVERKVPKERHVRKVPTVLSLRILSPYLRAISPEAKWQRAVRSRFDVWPRCRRHGRPPRVACRYTTARFLYVSSKTATCGRVKSAASARTALCRSCGCSGLCDIYARSGSFAYWRKSRAV